MNASAAPVARRRFQTGLWLFVVALLACHFALNLQQNGKTHLDADAYSHYTEKRPYQYRVLMAPVLGELMHVFSRPAAQAVIRKLPVYVATPEAASYFVINAIGFAASCLLMGALARKALVDDTRVQLTLGIYIGMAYLFIGLNPNVAFILPYDLPSLALSQACLLCVLTRRWGWLYPLFVLATVNRETSFLVVAFMAARCWLDAEPRRSLRHVAALTLLWVVVKIVLYLVFSNLPSDEGLRLGYNFHALLKPWQWPALLPLFASCAVALWSLRFAPAQRAWAATGLLGFGLIFVVGQITETRAFAELMVFFSLAAAQWLGSRRRV